MQSVYELARQKSEARLLAPVKVPEAIDKARKAKKKKAKEYRESHADEIRKSNAIYRETHREKIRQHNAETKEQRAQWWQGYYEKNKEKILEKQRERTKKYQEANDPNYRASACRRAKRYVEKLKQDPERYAEFKRKRNEYRRNKVLNPEQKAKIHDKNKSYWEKIKQDPELHAEYLRKIREYRRNKKCQKTLTNSSATPSPGTQSLNPVPSK